MDKIIIKGRRRLRGTVAASGAKNSALPILAATLLAGGKCVIKNIPQLSDIATMLKILKLLGMKVAFKNNSVTVEPFDDKPHEAPYKLVSTMRASICVLGPLLAKRGLARVSLPGGCVIGPRPIDLHIKGLKSLGARITLDKGYVVAKKKRLKGSHIYLGGSFGSSVLATANTMMAATLADGKTVIENAACEPEVVDLARFLVKMGARIEGIGSPRVEIEGVKRLKGAEHTIICDRIESVTYLAAGIITKGDVTVKGAQIGHMTAVADKFKEAGAVIKKVDGGVRAYCDRDLKPIDVTTLPYPGFPTDLQAQMMALMGVARGICVITEKIYPERFMHVSELARMGAQIILERPSAIVKGVRRLIGAPVMASDLRASASLVLAGLVAEGETEITRVYHLDRGYEMMDKKLSELGADIRRVRE